MGTRLEMSNERFAWLLITLGACGLLSVTRLTGAPGARAAEAVREITISISSPRKAFKPGRIEALPSQNIELTLVNEAGGNSKFVCDWVLSFPQAVTTVIASGMNSGIEAGDPVYNPAILAATPRVAPGESRKVIFEAPEEPGEYPFVCTVADHWKEVKGILVVKLPEWPQAWAGEWFDPTPPQPELNPPFGPRPPGFAE